MISAFAHMAHQVGALLGGVTAAIIVWGMTVVSFGSWWAISAYQSIELTDTGSTVVGVGFIATVMALSAWVIRASTHAQKTYKSAISVAEHRAENAEAMCNSLQSEVTRLLQELREARNGYSRTIEGDKR